MFSVFGRVLCTFLMLGIVFDTRLSKYTPPKSLCVHLMLGIVFDTQVHCVRLRPCVYTTHLVLGIVFDTQERNTHLRLVTPLSAGYRFRYPTVLLMDIGNYRR